MLHITFAILTLLQSTAAPPPQDEVKDALSHAEALYYAARFNDSIGLLTRVDDLLKSQPGRQQEKIETKLRLALANIGLNDTTQAHTYFMALYSLDPDYALDAKQFSPKVIAVASDAKTETAKARCFSAQTDARSLMDSGQAAQLLDLFRSSATKCAGLAAMAPEAAESFYKTGIASYKRGEFSNALTGFEAALALSPEHELALQYAELTRNKLQLEQDQLLAQWQRNFDARKFDAAKADYGRISANGNPTAVAHANEEYRKALTLLVDNWNKSCGRTDIATLNALRGQVSDLIPVPSFGDDIRARMNPCEETKPASVPAATTAPAPSSAGAKGNAAASAPPAAAKGNTAAASAPSAAAKSNATANASVNPAANAAVTCFDMQTQLALTRLKTRVDPVITNELRSFLKNNTENIVRVKTRINETGDVTVMSIPEGNPILNNVVRTAVSQWKFTPIRDANGPRCVDTEIPIILKIGQ
jgi:tetratricopeptide (TPR) repeat protein